MAIILMAMNSNNSSSNSTDIQSQEVYLGETLRVAGKCLNEIGHFHCVLFGLYS